MNELTKLIKSEIKKQYGSVRSFSEALGIPQSTVVSSIKKGIGGTSFETVTKMCSALGIRLMEGNVPVRYTEQTDMLVKSFSSLDEMGRHTVMVVLKMEMERCKNAE